MPIAEIAIRRPIFMTCLVLAMLAVGTLSFFRLPVDQFPTVDFPWIGVVVVYPGAGPEEIGKMITKPIEEEVRTISGLKKSMSFNNEGGAAIYLEFQLESDPNYNEQQVRDRVALARRRMPKDIEEPLIYRYNPTDQPAVSMALQGPLSLNQLYELADRKLRPSLEQVPKVGQVNIFGGSKREIQVQLDREKLEAYELSVSQVAQALTLGGQNIPLGKRPDPRNPGQEIIYRSLGEFNTLQAVRSAIIKFLGNDVPVRVSDLGQVRDSHQEETSHAFLNGSPSLILEVTRQSGANTVAVAEGIKRRAQALNRILAQENPGCSLRMLRDGAKSIRDNVQDVGESILIGVGLCVLVVFLFLGSLRSTLITGVALPNSLIGGFVLVAAAGFSINTLTLVALSLAVGLLIDDAIVVRENIFRHMELGAAPKTAAVEGTGEVQLAVVATTLAILSVFGPIAFVGGITGKFLREFGLTVCFVMLISLFDALTMGPMLSAYFAGKKQRRNTFIRMWTRVSDPIVAGFERLQTTWQNQYALLSAWTVRHPGRVLLGSVAILGASLWTLPYISKTFLPTPDTGELIVSLELPPGASLAATETVALAADQVIRSQPAVLLTSTVVGFNNGDPTQARIYVQLRPASERKLKSGAYKLLLREQLKPFITYRVKITEFDPLFGGEQPFALKLLGNDPEVLKTTAWRLLEYMQQNPGFVEADLNHREGKPEMQLVYDERKTKQLGVSTSMAGGEVRAQMEGLLPAKFRDRGEEWDIRVRLQDEDRDLKNQFRRVLVPNLNGRLVNLSQVAKLVSAQGPATVYSQDGQRMILISSDMAKGIGVGDLMNWVNERVKTQKLLPPGVRLLYEGQGEQYEEMSQNMLLAVGMAVLFIYLVLASLYESFLTPFTLLLPLPLALCGAFVALWIGRESLNIYSIIAAIMLLGIATKNSILLIDYTRQLAAKGMDLREALVEAGRTRLRPILMTSMTLVAGTLPLAIGLNEASKQRTSMGWVIIGGVISSTLLTLVVVPAAVSWFQGRKKKTAGAK